MKRMDFGQLDFGRQVAFGQVQRITVYRYRNGWLFLADFVGGVSGFLRSHRRQLRVWRDLDRLMDFIFSTGWQGLVTLYYCQPAVLNSRGIYDAIEVE